MQDDGELFLLLSLLEGDCIQSPGVDQYMHSYVLAARNEGACLRLGQADE